MDTPSSHATPAKGARAKADSPHDGERAKPSPGDAPARRVCKAVCSRDDVAAINEALYSGISASQVSIRFFGTRNSKDALGRHALGCLGLVDAKKARNRRSATSRRLERALTAITVEPVTLETPAAILREHERRYQHVSSIIEEAKIAKNHRVQLAAEDVRGKILGDATRLQGFEKSSGPLINVQFQKFEAAASKLSLEQINAAIESVAAGRIPDIPGLNSADIEGELITTC